MARADCWTPLQRLWSHSLWCVWSGFIENPPFAPPQVGSGTLFLSCVIPIGDATFGDVVGRDPMNGESVAMLDAATQNLHDNYL